MTNSGALLARGIRRHQAGQLAKAERAYRDVLARDPENADALHLLGVVAANRGDQNLAATLIAGAIRLRGPVARYCASLGGILRAQGKTREAAVCYGQAAAHDTEDCTYPVELARTLLSDSRPAEAADVLGKHLARHSDSATAWHLLGITFHQAGSYPESVEALRQAVRIDPNAAEPWCALGIVLSRQEAWSEAESAYRKAIAVRADFPEALNNLGNLLRRRGCAAEAIPYYRRALRRRADYLEAHYNLGLALQELQRLEEARSSYSEALRLDPRLAAAHNNLANTLQSLGAAAQAMPHFRRAVDLDRANREYRVNLGMAQLLLGEFDAGWRNYAARSAGQLPGHALWEGQPLDGRRILLRAEQGYGDTIQFIRYGSLLQQRGGVVHFSCPLPLARLMATAPGIDRLLAEGVDLPSCDFWAPLLHLPGALETRLDSVPAAVPYLAADPELARAWQEDLAIPPSHLKVGIAWRGSASHRNDANRSIDPSDLSVLAGVPDTTFVSLQAGHPAGCPESRLPFAPLGRDLTDFADTAALLIGLDLVISVDTSIAHLAGALARPVWTLLPFAPDWRWMNDRHDSPWYPTMRLFRQTRRRDWRTTLERIREELTAGTRESEITGVSDHYQHRAGATRP